MQIIIEGWRFLPHSYAITNQFQLLEMLKQPQLQIYHQDMPYISKNWQPVTNLFPQNDETALRNIPKPSPQQPADATLRMYAPFNLKSSKTRRTGTFICTEWGIVTKSILQGMGVNSFAEAHVQSDTIIITPSHWSKQGLLRSGAEESRVTVIPLGVNPNIYYPLPIDQKNNLRQKFGVDNCFIFLNVGVMCNSSQGVGRLLKAFATIVEDYPNTRLILKGRDAIFPSQDSITKAGKIALTDAEMERIKSRIIYFGRTLSFMQLAQLYQIADAYVSPYSAEGFNLPVLEAVACGLPIICTKGGPTDDFTHPNFTLAINSKLQTNYTKDGETLWFVLPEQEHLVELMKTVIEKTLFREQARKFGPQWVVQNFTWKQVVEQLLDLLVPSLQLRRPIFEPIIL
ncbi:glycosyltransferase [Okeania sp.]|uniref:glycosyltransferase n=1 Tax=Okeania sp. TaxID=3100323 RepID=UPI002B4B6CB0|nr:glycosyltransferase [Okeania sp.]MEB3343146.1 glycosyltransferase [Okeania sp.]